VGYPTAGNLGALIQVQKERMALLFFFFFSDHSGAENAVSLEKEFLPTPSVQPADGSLRRVFALHKKILSKTSSGQLLGAHFLGNSPSWGSMMWTFSKLGGHSLLAMQG